MPDDNKLPPAKSNLLVTHCNNLTPHRSQLPPLKLPPCLHHPTPPVDTTFDISSRDSPIHSTWQSTELYTPTPPSMNFNDIPSMYVNGIFNKTLEGPVEIYSSCRFPPEDF